MTVPMKQLCVIKFHIECLSTDVITPFRGGSVFHFEMKILWIVQLPILSTFIISDFLEWVYEYAVE